MKEAPTIRTLAKIAGVSNATVSLALRNHPRIRPATRQRIQQIATEAGYKSNAVLANLLAHLRRKKTLAHHSTLGLLSAWENPALHEATPTFLEWIAACQERAESLGYSVDKFCLAEPLVAPEGLAEILHARNIRGFLVIGSELGRALRPDLNPLFKRAAAIALGVRPLLPPLSYVSNDQFETTARAMNEVLQLGYKRPGLCISATVDNRVSKRFSGGYYSRQSTLPFQNCVPKCERDAEESFKSWLNQYRPDVILTLNSQILGWVESMGLKVPEDIGVVHLDKDAGMAWAGMQQNNRDLGRAAVDMLIGQLHRNEYGIPPFQKGLLITSTWSPGPTVRQMG